MARQAIKDKNYRIIGYIETMPDGKRKAVDAGFRTLGFYDPKRNVTQDKNYQRISEGDVLSALIMKNC